MTYYLCPFYELPAETLSFKCLTLVVDSLLTELSTETVDS